jgi:hypothetical protein
VCDFIEEPYEQGMITMENAIRFGNKPIDLKDYKIDNKSTDSPNSNESEMILSNREVAYVQSSASSEMLKHNYSLEDVKFSTLDWVKYLFFDWPTNYAGGLLFKYSSSNSRNIQAQPY